MGPSLFLLRENFLFVFSLWPSLSRLLSLYANLLACLLVAVIAYL